MLQVTAKRIVNKPEYQIFSSEITIHGFDRLTPKTARAALEIAFGNSRSGQVWNDDRSYGYQIYEKSARKIFSDEP